MNINPIKKFYHRITSAFGYQNYLRNPRFKDSLNALRALQNMHEGDRCFIIGNGPSLNETDLSFLRDEYTFGLNRIYLLFPKMGFSTSYYVINNRLVLKQFKSEIVDHVPVTKFTSWENYDLASDIPNMNFIYRHNGANFYRDITKGIWGGGTVTFAAMQIAYYLGFKTTILIGVDHSFKSSGKPNETVISSGNDPDHFDKNYFGKGVRWQLPDLETSEYAYTLAREAYRESGRIILDATIGGRLEVFDKIDYKSLFAR